MEDEIEELLADINANDNYENDFDEVIIFKINENNHLQDEIFVA
jgi:hypothetical protein